MADECNTTDKARERVARAICPKVGFCPRHSGCTDFTCPPVIWPAADAALLAMGVMAPHEPKP